MDIQSSALNATFVLFPVFVVNWITPVKPAALAHGGVPRSIYDDVIEGLLCVIDPWTELQRRSLTMAAYDSVKLYVNDDPDHVASATVRPGDEQKRIELDVPHGRLVEGVNRLHYVVTRLGGNSEPSRDLFVLYYPLAPYNLKLNVPSNVITPALAAQGVTFSFTYNALRAYDLIRLRIGNKTFTYEVPDPATPPSITLYTDDFKDIGDGPTQASFIVTDQLTNSRTSANTALDIQVDKVEPLLAPKIVEAGGNTLVPENAVQTLRGQIDISKLAPTGTLTLFWIAAAGLPAQASFTSAAIPVGTGATRDIPIPVSVVAYSIGKTVTVRYVYASPGGAAPPSPDLTLSISPLSRLSQPWIVQADNSGQGPVLDIGKLTANLECRMGVWAHIANQQPVWMILKGTNSDGTSYEKRLWNVPGAAVNPTWITQGSYPQGWALAEAQKLLDGSSLTVTFKAALDMNQSEALATVFPVRPYTVRNTVNVTLPAPTVREAPNNASLAPLAAKDSLTAIVNYPMQAGDKISVTWKGVAGEGSHTTALINAGTQPQQIPLPNSVVAFNLNKKVTVTYTVTRGGVALPASPALTLSVLALPDIALPRPRILQAADAGNGIEFNVANLTGNAILRFDPWSFIAVGQPVFLSLNGTYADGRQYNFVIWQSDSGAYVNQNWVTNGYEHGVANTELKKLKEGSALNIVFKVGFGKSTNEAEAVTFRLRTYTVRSAVTLPAPTVREAPNNASLAPLAAKDSLTAIVNYPMQAGDRISVTWKGVAGEGSHTTALINAGAQPQQIPLPNSVVAFNLNKTVTVTYTVTRGGVALPASPALTLSVLALPDTALPKPRILQAADDGNGIELNVANLTGNATLRFDPWGLIAIYQPVFLSLNGTYADGRQYNFVIWQSDSGAYVNQNWITNGYEHGVANTELKKLKEGSALNIVFKVGFGKSTNEAEAVTFPLRTYTVRTVALVAPVISGVKDAAGWDIPDNGYTVRDSVTISGTAPAGQQVEVFDGNVSKGKVTATGGTWSIPLNGLGLNVLHSITAVGQYGSNPRSNVWRITSVQGISPTLDLVKETDTGTPIPDNGSTSKTAVTVEGAANSSLRVQLYDNGNLINGAIATAGTNNRWSYPLTGLSLGAHGIKAKALYGSGTESQTRNFRVSTFTVDLTRMTLNGIKLIPAANYGLDPYEVTNNTRVRTPTGGVPPYRYESKNPAIASVDSNGKVSGLRNGSTNIVITDSNGSTASYDVTVSNVYTLTLYDSYITAAQAVAWMKSLGATMIDNRGEPLGWGVHAYNFRNYASILYGNQDVHYGRWVSQNTEYPLTVILRFLSSSGDSAINSPLSGSETRRALAYTLRN